MKNIIISILLLNVTFTYGQTTLLKSQVYDFSLGDIFMTEYTQASSSGQGRTDYRLDTIKAIITNTVDSFRYVTSSFIFYRDFAFPANSYAGHMHFYDTITISGMDSVAKHRGTFCGVRSDTIEPNLEYCSALTWTETAQQSSCSYESNLVEGCGGPYYHTSSVNPSNGQGMAITYDLIYFKKAGNECGQILTSIKEIANLKSLKIYPNPVGRFISLEGVDLNSELTIFSINGIKQQRIMYNGQSISVEGLREGVYFLQVRTENKRDQILKFIK